MTRRVFRRFRYTECDDFAAYLMKMAREGWHFKGWKLGLIFEKGEPEEAEYVVDIFIKGNALDTRPEADTKEFAEYCEAAGWEFIDSTQKFCVFKKRDEDAYDIVTSEERIINAGKAEIKNSCINVICELILISLYVPRFLTETFYHSIFQNSLIIIVLWFILSEFYYIAYFIKTIIWYYRKKKKVDTYELYIGIGEEKQRKRYWREIGFIIFFEIGFLIGIGSDRHFGELFIILPILLLFFASTCLIEYIRPSRSMHVLSIFGISVMVPVLLLLFVFSNDTEDNVYTDKSLAPLLQEDYREVKVPFENVEINISSNALGSINDYYVSYHEYDEKIADDNWDCIQYIIVESEYDWVIEHSWNTLIGRLEEYKDYTEAWDATVAVRGGEWFDSDYVRYDNQIFILTYEKILSQEQINIIREKIGLGQVM